MWALLAADHSKTDLPGTNSEILLGKSGLQGRNKGKNRAQHRESSTEPLKRSEKMDEGPKQAAISSSWTSLTAKERSKDTAGVAERLKHENGKVTAVTATENHSTQTPSEKWKKAFARPRDII